MYLHLNYKYFPQIRSFLRHCDNNTVHILGPFIQFNILVSSLSKIEICSHVSSGIQARDAGLGQWLPPVPDGQGRGARLGRRLLPAHGHVVSW